MKRLLGLLFAVVASMPAVAQSSDCTALTQQALDISGANQDIDALGQMLMSDEYLSQVMAGKENSADFTTIFKPIVRKNLDGTSLKRELLRRVAARCRPEEMSQAIKEMQTPFVAHMLQLEAERYTPAGQEKIKKYTRIIQIAPPPDSQLSSADAFDQKVGVTNFTVDYLVAVTQGMLAGAGAPDDVVADLKTHRKQMQAQIQVAVQASILMTYNGVSRADLAKYGKELSSGPLKWYYDAVHQSFIEMLEQRARAIGQDIKSATLSKQN